MTFKPVNESDLPRFQGKGDRQRPSARDFYENYSKIFGELYVSCRNCGARINNTKFNECPWCSEPISTVAASQEYQERDQ